MLNKNNEKSTKMIEKCDNYKKTKIKQCLEFLILSKYLDCLEYKIGEKTKISNSLKILKYTIGWNLVETLNITTNL